jgi:G3E family GTPase
MQPTPFSVIGGFLGAGKTSLVNDLLKNATGRYAILVNDFGRLNIDQMLISEHDGETIALANGCICCSLAAGFSEGLTKIIARIEAFDHVFVEASGVANPQRIQDIARIERALVPRGNVVLVDASNIRAQAEDKHIGSLVLEQINAADLLIVNKQDLLNDEQRRGLNLYLDQISDATRFESKHSHVPTEMILNIAVQTQSRELSLAKQNNSHDLYSAIVCSETAVSRRAFEQWNCGLAAGVIRGKGIVHFIDSDISWLWQKVADQYQLTPLESHQEIPVKNCQVVLIAKKKTDLPASFFEL